MKLLIFGSNGQLGLCLRDQLINSNYEIHFCTRDELDITDSFSVHSKILTIKPDIVINAAAYTEVDKSENEKEMAQAINVYAVNTIAESCKIVDAVLIHMSTDYVFDGESNQPYKENSQVCPIGTYGLTKLLGEEAIKKSQCRYIVIRTSWLFSQYGNNFLKTMLRLGSSKDIVNVVNDEIGCPTYVPDLANGILSTFDTILRSDFNSGIYNFTGQSICSWYEFSIMIFNQAKLLGLKVPNKVLPINSSNYETLAQRPNYSVLDNTKFSEQFGIICSNLDTAISSVVSNLKHKGLL